MSSPLLCFKSFLIIFLHSSIANSQTPVDPLATKETKCLYKNLYEITHSSSQFIFGHHHDNYEGQTFKDKTGLLNESDIKTDTGYFPGFIEYNIDTFLSDNANFTNHILNAVSKGLMVGWYWLVCCVLPGIIYSNQKSQTTQATNPVTGGSCNDLTDNPVVQLMPNHSGNKNWTAMLDRFADFIQTLHLPNGNLIPMVMRPFHEMLGDWYWWGQNNSTPNQYIAAYNYTRWYLVENKGLHNLLFVFAPNKPYSYYGNNAENILMINILEMKILMLLLMIVMMKMISMKS